MNAEKTNIKEFEYCQVAEKVLYGLMLSFLRKQESSLFRVFWTPAFAGVTANGSFSAS